MIPAEDIAERVELLPEPLQAGVYPRPVLNTTWYKTQAFTTKNAKGTKMKFDGLSNRVIGCAIQVHVSNLPG
jgi:hypothetical protein